MSKQKSSQLIQLKQNRSNPISANRYRPRTPSPPKSSINLTPVVLDSVGVQLPPIENLTVTPSEVPHSAKNIGGTDKFRGHRVTGPLTSEVDKFLAQKYLRHYGYIDGVLRFLHLQANETCAPILRRYVSEMMTVMKNGGDLDPFSPKNWRNGNYRALFQTINAFNRRRDDVDCPINDLRLIDSLKPDHPRYKDAVAYLQYYQNNSVFGLICGKFYDLVKKLAEDVREYDVNIQIKDHTFGYRIKKGHYDSVTQFLANGKNDCGSVVRISSLEAQYDYDALVSKCANRVELVYVDNLRVLYMSTPTISATMLQISGVSGNIERNLYQFITHDYKRIGNGFFSSMNSESDAMDLVRNNMTTIECHMRPKFGKFYLSIKRKAAGYSNFNFTLVMDASKATYHQDIDIITNIDSATYLGYIVNGQMVVTDLLRINEREANSDLSRMGFDHPREEAFAAINVVVLGARLADDKCYDVILRSEYGVFRAKSLVKHRVYDKIGWFYDYVQALTPAVFNKLYEIKHLKFKRIVDTIISNLEAKVAKNMQMLQLNDGIGDFIVTLDNRFIPPLLVGIEEIPSTPRQLRSLQNLTGELYQLNKYYVLSKMGDRISSIDSPSVVFSTEYEDDVLKYKNVELDLETTTFARFFSDWEDEIYRDGKLCYANYFELERQAKNYGLSVQEESCHMIDIYQPFYQSREENFLSALMREKLNIEPDTLMMRRQKAKVRRPDASRKADILGDADMK